MSRPSERAAASWLGCTDSIPARYTSETYAVYTRTSETTAQKNGESGIQLTPSAGMPKPSMMMIRIVGTPRKKSV